ncbi:hypothetical protein Sjap_016064 [Stephania japonica]|uniref:Uncharacterized protein n=1 Tax=Stephania japonica TaxID=461633 RepID=A0AAP0IKK1_9MAGN
MQIPGASTSEMPDMVPRAEFNVVAEQLRKVMEFMQEASRDEHGRSGAYLKEQPPPPPSHRHLMTKEYFRPIIPILTDDKSLKLVVVVFSGEDSRMLLKYNENHKLDSLQPQNLQSLDNQLANAVSFMWESKAAAEAGKGNGTNEVVMDNSHDGKNSPLRWSGSVPRRYLALSWFRSLERNPCEYALSPLVVVLEMENHKCFKAAL